MSDITMTPAGQFRPISRDDFSRYAKALSWLIEEPIHKSREILARIYGYADVHELNAVLAKPGTPGPFSDEWFRRGDDGELIIDNTISPAARGNRILEQVTAGKGLPSLVGLPSRYWKSRDIGLFERPQRHREEFKRVRAMLEVLNAEGETVQRAASAYAQVGTTVTDANEYVLHFTPLGQAVFDAIQEILNVDRSQRAQAWERLVRLAEQHPNNPWVLTELILVSRSGEAMTEDEAQAVFEEASRAITLFEDLYEGFQKQAPESALGTPGADCYRWPAVLYWGGVAAARLGNLRMAKRWLKLNMKICPRDEFGARYIVQQIAPTKTLGKRLEKDILWT